MNVLNGSVRKTTLPVPESDVDSEPFWQGLTGHRMLFQRCDECSRLRFPAMSHCPFCSSRSHNWDEASGRGSVYSWIVVRQAFWPEFEGEVPYALLTVDLDEGVRVVGRMDDVDAPKFGQRVETTYVQHPDWVEFRFVEAIA